MILEVGTLPEMLLQKNQHVSESIWFGYLSVLGLFSPYNLRYFSFPEVVKSIVAWPLPSPPRTSAVVFTVCLNIRKHEELKESRIAAVPSVPEKTQ